MNFYFSHPTPRIMHRQGSALVLALGMTLLISALSAALFLRGQLAISNTRWLISGTQIHGYQLSAERAASLLLASDDDETGADHLGESWAQQLPPLTLQYGVINAKIIDAQGLFNINNLVQDGQKNQIWFNAFNALLSHLKVDLAIADQLVDWLDADLLPTSSDGAEDDLYLSTPIPHRTPNSPIADVGEIKSLLSITPEDYKKLKPWITALPITTKINLNTAPKDVLMAVIHNNKDLAEGILSLQKGKNHDAKTYGALFSQAGATFPSELVDVKSQFFLLHTDINLQKIQQRFTALLDRTEKKVKVKKRLRKDES